ncbi:helix-turn-helix domain-containing protein [Nocardia sp. NBC_00565]|uniref:PucR family transcriptional regulator n=1 Tax=Nocardia sp. NBC_00565 TaxID=2975993 RepID=UPI002E8071FB|nr:helix-turn-helix domain-containing protein [Nocardia sp. NBC_00565]WUC01932.1 helix-turn-helix domain-containing protein [Nocardia sp. NBC_00565]
MSTEPMMNLRRDSPGRDITISGHPASEPLRDVRDLSRKMVSHFVDHVAPCGTLPGDALGGEVTTITRVCLQLAASMLDGEDLLEESERVQRAAAEWAREGIPIEAIHHAVHEGLKMAFDLIVMGATTDDYASMLDVGRRFLDIVDRITPTVAQAYMRELRSVASEHHMAVHTLASALLGGQGISSAAREYGIPIAASYFVLAVAIPQHRDELITKLDAKVVGRRKLRRIQAELALRCDDQALALLSADGGTVLIPVEQSTGDRVEELVAHLSRAGQVSIRAAMVRSATDAIPEATHRAHELLDMVHRLDLIGGVYRFNDLVVEYQLTRPGPARDRLEAILAPLDEHPELFETLRVHISNNLSRQRTARQLCIHVNTLDYRCKRIGQLTGFNPTQSRGQWYLRSALVARTYRTVGQPV